MIQSDGLLGQHHGGRAHLQLMADLRKVRTANACHASPGQDRTGQGRVLAGRGQDKHALLEALVLGHEVSPSRDGPPPPSNVGTPVSTPRNSRNGAPTLIPPR